MVQDSGETPFSTPRKSGLEIVTYMGKQMLKYVANSDMVATVWTMPSSSIYTITITKDAAHGKFVTMFSVSKDADLLELWENIEKHVFLRLAQQ